MAFRVNLTIEVDQVANALAIQTPVPIQLVCDRNRWQAFCESPPVATEVFDSMEQAVIACSEQVAAEVQMAVEDRPVVLARITPDDIPAGMFG